MSVSPQFGSLVPSQTQALLSTNYLQFNSAAGGGTFAQQYLPEIYEAEVERYGNRTLSGFLRMVGAEMPMTSDQVIWSEQNRLHVSYDGVDQANIGGGSESQITINPGAVAGVSNVISLNDTVVVLDPVTGLEAKGVVTATVVGAAGTITVQPFSNLSLNSKNETLPGCSVDWRTMLA